MNHQILIDFNIDDEAVEKHAIEYAAKKSADEILEKVFEKSKYGYNSYYDRTEKLMSEYVKSIVAEFLEPHKAEIIESAVKEVVKNLHRAKLVKEMLEKSE